VDEQQLKDSFARVAAHGDEVVLFFFSHLFLAHPEVRDMFPVSMSVTRDRLLNALGQIVSDVSNHDNLVPYLRELGRDHRKFGAVAEHYPAVGHSLVAALAHFSGDAWNDEVARDWTDAYTKIATVMIEAARRDEQRHNPPWWDATIVGHERRAIDIAVVTVAPAQPLSYRPGQSVTLEIAQRPRLWRPYSMANAPRPDGTVDFHVKIIDGGQVSPVLGRGPGIGTAIRLGPPFGSLALDTGSANDIVMAAGGTGLAPLKAILEQLGQYRGTAAAGPGQLRAAAASPGTTAAGPGQSGTVPKTHLFFGARTAAELYDLPDLEKLADRYPWLTVTSAVSHERGPSRHCAYADGSNVRIESGTVADVLSRRGTWRDHDAYVCGSEAMVTATVSRLTALGVSPERIFVENFGWSEL
jgi:NAD(P)H-flavin reductase/hemoglobin-like flavoprotein